MEGFGICEVPVMTTKKFLLAESDLPTHWYNIAADLKTRRRHRCTRVRMNPSARRRWRRSFRWN
jgi:hypothetical protein